MKTLIINGSPRRDGHSAAVIEYLRERLDCLVIDCCTDTPKHCTGCDMCIGGKCVIDDKMQEYYALIERADSIIFVSPLYFSMLTGALLTFASRWQYFYHNSLENGKKGAVILLGGGSTKDISKAYSTAAIIMRYAGIKNPACADFVGTDREKPLENAEFVKKLEFAIEHIKN